MGFGVVGAQGGGLLVGSDGFGELIEVFEGEAEVLPCIGVVRLKFDGAIPVADSLGQLSLRLAGVSHGIEGLGIIRLHLNGLFKAMLGVFPFAALLLEQTDLKKNVDGARVQFKGLKEVLGGLVEIAGEPGRLAGLKVP